MLFFPIPISELYCQDGSCSSNTSYEWSSLFYLSSLVWFPYRGSLRGEGSESLGGALGPFVFVPPAEDPKGDPSSHPGCPCLWVDYRGQSSKPEGASQPDLFNQSGKAPKERNLSLMLEYLG
ncbi:hypothetical protein V6N12_076028 [Hibiscus sabdariffa]|uniref:Uncharacterized protein n=1 Tax=Hibiscus sabdariffa TaxID=183260 RepID=A0ABR2AY17_9ROSI